jgi:hypothetical protein
MEMTNEEMVGKIAAIFEYSWPSNKKKAYELTAKDYANRVLALIHPVIEQELIDQGYVKLGKDEAVLSGIHLLKEIKDEE